jgi:hypothetical protein
MNQREQLEWAAKACGYEYNHILGAIWVNAAEGIGGIWVHWNPLTDQGDSDRMACALDINTNLLPGRAYAVYYYKSELIECDAIERRVDHDGTLEDKCRAVREARMAVAVEIGRSK